MNTKNIYSLSQLSRSVQNAIQQYCSKTVWIKAEIVKLNYYSQSGHCYPALVEKRNGRVIAEMRGNIWSTTFEAINAKFKKVLKEELRDDMTVVLKGSVTYHPIHGLSLNILDIDPEYTLGELAREKASAIEKLKSEDLFEANKRTSLPTLPKTLAIISVETSKGYQDFLNIMETNPHGFKFHHLLFRAILQGERAITTICQQLEHIAAHAHVFDAVAIIRGGGGEIGLSCFDDYYLAKKIAGFPLPVLTGIGHSTNETVSELVSYQSFITPTKIAEFLLQKFHDFYVPVEHAGEQIGKEANRLFKNQKSGLQESARLFNSLTNRTLDRNKTVLEQIARSLVSGSQLIFRNEKEYILGMEKNLVLNARSQLMENHQKVRFSEEKLRLLSPENVLKRGYSITRQKGKAIRDPGEVDPEEIIETQLYKGKILSHIEKIKK